MPGGFLPSTDSALLAWCQNFYSVANLAAATYGLTSAQLTAFNSLVTSYQTALAACDPGVRSRASVMAKNTARAYLQNSARLLSKIVQGQAAVTNAQKTALGLTVRALPQPIPAPAFPPQVDVVSVTGRGVRIRLHNSMTADRRGRPAGVKGAAVFSFVGDVAPTDPGLYKFEGNTTRTTVEVAFPSTVAAGTTVWITAMWFNERAQSGPAATPVQAVIQYGMAMAG